MYVSQCSSYTPFHDHYPEIVEYPLPLGLTSTLHQDKLATKANAQIYQMWKVQEELRSECAAQEQTNLVKEYTCEVFDICNALVRNEGVLRRLIILYWV